MPCQVPRANRPAATGIDSDTAVSAALICAGMSSGPSVVCVTQRIDGSFEGGTSRRKKASRSRRTSGSAFSWISSEQDVCLTNSVSSAVSTFDSRTNEAAASVNS